MEITCCGDVAQVKICLGNHMTCQDAKNGVNISFRSPEFNTTFLPDRDMFSEFSEQLSRLLRSTDKSSSPEAVSGQKIPHGETDPTRRRTLKQSPPGFRRARNSGKGCYFYKYEVYMCVW